MVELADEVKCISSFFYLWNSIEHIWTKSHTASEWIASH